MNEHVHPIFKSLLDTVNPDRTRYSGMSDNQLEAEYLARRYLERALRMMREAISVINDASAVVQIDAKAFEAFVHDECPDEKFWDERIEKARTP